MVAVHAALGRWKGSSVVQKATGRGSGGAIEQRVRRMWFWAVLYKHMKGRLGDATSNVLGGAIRNERDSGARGRRC